MKNSAISFFAGAILVFAIGAVWFGMSEYQRREEERRVMEFLTTPSTKGFEPVIKD